MELTQGDAVRDVVERELLLRAQTLFALQLQTLVGNLTSLLLGLEHMECVAGSRGSVQAEDDARLGGLGLLDALVTLVEHSLDTSPSSTSDDVITNLQRAMMLSPTFSVPFDTRTVDT